MYNLIFVDVNREYTLIHRINVITGDYLNPVRFNDGDIPSQVNRLIKLLKEDKPDKIIFDKNGYGYPFYYYFMETVKVLKGISVDSFGLITYEEVQ